MQSAFLQYIDKNKLFSKKSKVILAVSGGIDSMTMASLFASSDYKCAVAHCNFSLRGSESDGDELLVKKMARKYKMPFHSKRFETEKYAKQNGISIQMAARELRYNWFNQLLDETKFDYIAIAHNKNDIAETFFLNLTRGTGLKGLTGIKAKADKIVRPLLFASREDIIAYAKENKIEYREDSSNSSMKYSRNRIRNKVIPELKKINQNFDNSIIETIDILNTSYEILAEDLARKKIHVSEFLSEPFRINIKRLLELEHIHYYLFEFIREYGFNASQVNDIINSLDMQPGKKFYSDTHLLVKDRDHLIIEDMNDDDPVYRIGMYEDFYSKDIDLEISEKSMGKSFRIIKNENIAQLDEEKLDYPLILRKWRHGDKFIPLGMKSYKKLSDFFSDNKLSVIDKKNIWILESDEKIVWVVGMRIDNRFKITDKTKQILTIKIK